MFPHLPKNLKEYSDIVNSENWSHLTLYKQGKITFVSFPILSEKRELKQDEQLEGHVTIMANIDLLKTMDFERVLIDATFDVCPRIPQNLQFCTIMAHFRDTVTFKN